LGGALFISRRDENAAETDDFLAAFARDDERSGVDDAHHALHRRVCAQGETHHDRDQDSFHHFSLGCRERDASRVVVGETEDTRGALASPAAAWYRAPMHRRLALVLCLLAAACGREAPARRPVPPPAAVPVSVPAPPVAEPKFVCENDWTKVSDGIDYRMLNCSPDRERFDLHLVRIDPKRTRIDAVLRPNSSAQAVAREGWKVALNANFFDERKRPLGVVMSGGKELNKAHVVSWQSVFYVTKNDRARIAPVLRWKDLRAGARTAAQAGPRIIVAGERNRVARATPSWRTGVCIDGKGRAVLFATPRETLLDVEQMVDLADRAEDVGGMGCRDAMLFDGGGSTALFIDRGARSVTIPGDRGVPAYLVVKSR